MEFAILFFIPICMKIFFRLISFSVNFNVFLKIHSPGSAGKDWW